MKPSKNSRTSRADGASAAPAGLTGKHVIPLDGGTWRYLTMPDGRIKHLKVDSPQMDDTLAGIASDHGPRYQKVLRDLQALAHGDFPAALGRHVRPSAGEAQAEA